MRVGRLMAALASAAIIMAAPAKGILHAQARMTSINATTVADLRSWDTTVTRMLRAGDLQTQRSEADTLIPGRTHERLVQYYKGVRVFGSDITRQTSAGSTVSVFGTLAEGLDLDVTPGITVADAAAIITRETGAELAGTRLPELIVYPQESGARLAYHARAFTTDGATEFFIDALSGAILSRRDGVQRQSTAVGSGPGVLADTKKMSVTLFNGLYYADDELRPPSIATFDMKGNLGRTLAYLNGAIGLGLNDLASDGDNAWSDPASTDAHAYAGYVYDYYFKRFGRRGLDNQDLPMTSLVHPVSRGNFAAQPPSVIGDYYLNAFYAGDGTMVYGEGLPSGVAVGGQNWNYLAGALDIVGHELTHGVTDYTSGLIYANESGALNESFSDMMGTAVEFYFQPAGSGSLTADYLIGEDVVTPGGLRSMSNPAAYGQPDHYSKRLITPNDDAHDNGGVHTNSGIGNQAYYLAIEGGTNRTSGLAVQGVGAANREQIEKVMYRGFTQLMPANATYSVARAVTIQAARDLYGAGSNAERAITQAWTAVGVN